MDGKVALVTGVGSGIGRAVATRLASEGARVFGVDLDGAAAEATAASVRAGGGTMEVQAVDVTRRDACRGAVAAALEAFGQLDVLGNVAGIGRAEHFVDVSEADYRQMMGVNVDGYVFMAQAAIPHLVHEGGAIVNIASVAGLMGQAYTVVYCMTKGAVVQLTKALAMEYVKTPLRVNAIAPGGIETNLTTTFAMPADVDFDLVMRYSGFRGMGRPEDIATLFAFLASDEAVNVHGAILTSDRGVTAG